jgi:hypothetical protein
MDYKPNEDFGDYVIYEQTDKELRNETVHVIGKPWSMLVSLTLYAAILVLLFSGSLIQIHRYGTLTFKDGIGIYDANYPVILTEAFRFPWQDKYVDNYNWKTSYDLKSGAYILPKGTIYIHQTLNFIGPNLYVEGNGTIILPTPDFEGEDIFNIGSGGASDISYAVVIN